MIVEILSVLTIFIGGCAFGHIVGIRGWPLPALGFVVGTALQVVIGTIQAVAGLPTTPVLTLGFTFGLPVTWWIVARMRGCNLSIRLVPAVITVITVVIVVIVLRQAHLVNWHTDTFRYLMTGSLIYSGNYDAVSLNLLTTRMLSVPLIHAPANLSGELYLRSVVPILAVSTVTILVWLIREGLRNKLTQTQVTLFTAAGVLLLVTNNRFVWNAFYINGHLFFAVLLLLIAGCGWLLVRETNLPQRALLALPLVALPALVVTRPEASLVAGLALLPALVSERIPWRHRAMLLVALGVSMLVWQGFLAFEYVNRGKDIPFSATGLLALGIVAILTVPLLAWRRLGKPLRYIPLLVEIVLWMALLVATIRNPDILYQSVIATVENVVLNAGSWGVSLVVLGMIILGVLALTNAPDRIFLRFPVTSFVPLSLLLAYFRDAAYRVGNGDSLNRMLLHILPLAILFIVSAAGSERWGIPGSLKTSYLQLRNRFVKSPVN